MSDQKETRTGASVESDRAGIDPAVQLAEAFVKACAEFPEIPTNRVAKIPNRPDFHYADLGQILRFTRPVLAKHGLALHQPVSYKNNTLIIKTQLFHSSGASSVEVVEYPVSPTARLQDIGTAKTYLSRYAVTGMLGISTEDDVDADLETAQKPQAANKNQESRRVNPPAATQGAEKPKTQPWSITKAHVSEIITLQKYADMSDAAMAGLIKSVGAETLKQVTEPQYAELVRQLNGLIPKFDPNSAQSGVQ